MIRETALKELRAKIRCGIQQADRGELLDGDAVFEEIRHLSARRRRKRGQTSSGSGTTPPKKASTARSKC